MAYISKFIFFLLCSLFVSISVTYAKDLQISGVYENEQQEKLFLLSLSTVLLTAYNNNFKIYSDLKAVGSNSYQAQGSGKDGKASSLIISTIGKDSYLSIDDGAVFKRVDSLSMAMLKELLELKDKFEREFKQEDHAEDSDIGIVI